MQVGDSAHVWSLEKLSELSRVQKAPRLVFMRSSRIRSEIRLIRSLNWNIPACTGAT